ncbi:16S rRNA (cytidine(1402)-2'-O)-methyltransferase [Calditerrivibrio sp.]|jgi:16S rRNA (cytidine1402-2'-O)-methyltransferase|uniref:16S rRNA (cytidine(1402)-2'-O)-methyltransferase n=1 Tax=Calditerrivibrio sp. TaxID=2792612 RepID=UPI003D125A17
MGKLYIVPTPIGNLGDITLRALDVLKNVDVIFSEDTRNTLALLNNFNIKKKLISYHKDNELKASEDIIQHVLSGETVALVSDAGTPCISDPGNIVVRKMNEIRIPVEVLPGATAFVPAVVRSGFPTERIYFCGFLPSKNKERRDFLNYLRDNVFASIVFYEAPHRIKDTLRELLLVFESPFAVVRELSKVYETLYFVEDESSLKDIVEKGEFIIVVNNNIVKHVEKKDAELLDFIFKLKEEGFSKQDIIKILKAFGVKRNRAYNLVIERD